VGARKVNTHPQKARGRRGGLREDYFVYLAKHRIRKGRRCGSRDRPQKLPSSWRKRVTLIPGQGTAYREERTWSIHSTQLGTASAKDRLHRARSKKKGGFSFCWNEYWKSEEGQLRGVLEKQLFFHQRCQRGVKGMRENEL